MRRSVFSVDPDEPVYGVVELMAEAGVRHVLVLEAGALVGIISNRDLIRGPMRHPQGRLDLHRAKARDIMTRAPLHTIHPAATLREAARSMVRHRVNALPVIVRGTLAGVITSHDLLLALEDISSTLARASSRFEAVGAR
jgi:CBS domain-containing protein